MFISEGQTNLDLQTIAANHEARKNRVRRKELYELMATVSLYFVNAGF
jgi:hypothetical protein